MLYKRGSIAAAAAAVERSEMLAVYIYVLLKNDVVQIILSSRRGCLARLDLSLRNCRGALCLGGELL